MALLKEITDNKGIVTNYHKIVEIRNIEQITIVVRSYVSEEFRNREVEANQKINRYNYLIENQSEETEDELLELSLKQPQYAQDLNLGISEEIYVVGELKDYSFENAYDYLKSLPQFKGAQDI